MPQFQQIEIFSSLIFWSIISFGIFMFVMKKYAFPPIFEILEAREKKISGDLQSAEDIKAAAEKLKKDFEEQLKAAHDKATMIVQLAVEESRKIQEKTLEETQAKCRQMQKEAEHEIQAARNQILAEIRGYIAALTITSAEKVLKRALTEDDKKRLVDESIDEVVSTLEKQA
ncbi:MAG: F0F1 ATP synthase subunit B [Nitrospinae bacterium]|nr:F0F1 ATP synthase subunit B [Nitrospinota bacterium]